MNRICRSRLENSCRLPKLAHVATAVCLVFAHGLASAGELPLPIANIDRSEPVNFQTEVMPILQRNCLACHHEKDAEGGLVLESLATIRKGGDTGPGVVAKDLNASTVFARASGTEEPLMPPEDNDVGAKPLTAEELALLKLWIEQGASGVDPSTSSPIKFQPIPETMRSAYAVDASPDGRYLAASRGNRVLLYETAEYTEVARLIDDSLGLGDVADVDLIQSLAFSPDGSRLATGGFRTVRIWRQKRTPSEQPDTPLTKAAGLVAVRSNDSVAAFVNAIGDIEIWDLSNATKLHTVAGHSDRVTGLVWAGDTDHFCSCDQSGRIIVWNASSGEQVAKWEAQATLTSLATSPDGTYFAAIDESGQVQLLQLSSENQLKPLAEPVAEVSDAVAVALYTQPVASIVVATESSGVQIRSLADNLIVRTIEPGSIVDALAISKDQAKLFSGERDGTIKVWNLADGTALATMRGDRRTNLQVNVAARNAARQKTEVDRLNQRTKALEDRLKKENEALAKVQEAQKQSLATLATQEKARLDAVALVKATEAKIGQAVADAKAAEAAIAAAQKALAEATAMKESATKELEEKKKAVAAADTAKQKTETVITNRKQTIASADAARKLAADAIPAHQLVVARATSRLTHLESRKAEQQSRLTNPSERIVAIDVSSDGKQIAAANLGGDIRLYRTSDGLPLDQFVAQPLLDRPDVCLVGDLVIGHGASQSTKVWSRRHAWTLERTIGDVNDPDILSDRVTALDFRPDGMTVAVGSGPPSRSGEVKIFAIESGELVRDFGPIHSDTVLGLDFSPDGRFLATAAADKIIRLLDVSAGKEVRSMEGHTHHVLGIAWQDDGHTLASAGADQTVKVWNVDTGQQRRTITGFGKELTAIAFIASTNQIASSCANGQVRISNTGDGKAIRTLNAAGDFLYCIDVSADGTRVIAGGHSGTVRVWNIADGAVVAELK